MLKGSKSPVTLAIVQHRLSDLLLDPGSPRHSRSWMMARTKEITSPNRCYKNTKNNKRWNYLTRPFSYWERKGGRGRLGLEGQDAYVWSWRDLSFFFLFFLFLHISGPSPNQHQILFLTYTKSLRGLLATADTAQVPYSYTPPDHEGSES